MSFDKENLFRMLPAFNRIRDQQMGNGIAPGVENDGPLKALLGLIAEQVAVLEENFDQLYDDQFIETCAEWVVPYIGDLVGTRGLVNFPGAPFSDRAQVANTLRYRRRKGTAAVIEELARDVTGWTASVVEYFQLLATNQYLNHLRPGNLSVASLKQWEQLEYANTPFDTLAHTVDVRNIASRRGKYNIPNIGIFLWRLDSYGLTNAPAFKVDALRYKFDALGKDIALYNYQEPEKEITHLAQPVNVPMPISRLVMHHYLADYYGANKSILVHDNTPVCVCNLSDKTDGSGDWVNMPSDKIAIDPVLGRIAFPAAPSAPVHVNYYYGFSDKMGGGEYARSDSFSTDIDIILEVPGDRPTIQAALNDLQLTGGIVQVTDNEYYLETPQITVAAGKKIELRAKDKTRPVLVLSGDLEITGADNAEVLINGLLISGGCLRVPENDGSGQPNRLRVLKLDHCTLPPGDSAAIGTVPAQPHQPRLIIDMPEVKVVVDKCIMGPVRAHDGAEVSISNSIMDALDESETAYDGINGPGGYGAVLTVVNTTIIGNVYARIMQLASNTIFYGDEAGAERVQEGCVRFSYVPPGSRLPKRHRCQPESAADDARMRPVFTSMKYGEAAYCQLSQHCAGAIRQGADNEAEMGAFNNLYQPQRITNLRTRLDEYMRFGLEAGIFYGS